MDRVARIAAHLAPGGQVDQVLQSDLILALMTAVLSASCSFGYQYTSINA